MLRFFKRMISTPPEVQVVDFSEGMVTFRPRTRMSPGRVTVRARVGRRTVRAVIRVDRFVAPDKIHHGELLGPGQAREFLRAAFPADPADQPQRIRRVLRVLSRQLPGFRATSLSIGCDGMLLEADGAVDVGVALRLDVELDDCSHEPLRLQGFTQRCRPHGAHHHLVEVEFRDLTAHQQTQLEAYVESRRALRTDADHQLAG